MKTLINRMVLFSCRWCVMMMGFICIGMMRCTNKYVGEHKNYLQVRTLILVCLEVNEKNTLTPTTFLCGGLNGKDVRDSSAISVFVFFWDGAEMFN